MAFREISLEELGWDPFRQIGRDWLLVTAGTKEACNGMTVSWGGLGVWWGMDVAAVYIRQRRFTKGFMDEAERFTVSAFAPEYRKALGYMGSHSGRDGDKWGPAGLTPMDVDGTAAPAEASVILVCRKVLATVLSEDTFIEPGMKEKWYGGSEDGNVHTMYIGAIEKVLINS